jgi:hypothetical protein
LELNLPHVVDEVTRVFAQYEAALTGNDVVMLDALFWASQHTLRYGITENLRGHAAIAAFRSARSSVGLARTLRNTVITTFGEDFATANTEFLRSPGTRVGRQSQTWVRMPEGWRVVSAHVSYMDPPTL